MLIRPLCAAIISSFAVLAAAAEPPPGPAAPPVPATPIASPDDAYQRLAASVDAFAQISERIDRETGRKDTKPRLFVNFGWLSRWSGPWPNDFAPREEFVALHQRVFDEAGERTIPVAFAQLAKADAIAIPPTTVGKTPAFNIDALRGLFEMNEFAFIRAMGASDQPKAAGIIATHLGAARLLAGATGSAASVGATESRRAVVITMPLVVAGSFDAKSRTALAGTITPLRIDRVERIAREVDYQSRAIPSQWETLPPALFTTGPDAAKAWNALDENVKVMFSNLVGARPALPLPSADAMAAEMRSAGERLTSWASLPPMEIRQRAAQLTKSAKTPAEAREERLILALAKGPQGASEAALAVDALRTVLAIEAFHDATGNYPRALDELVPKYLPAIPADPGKPGSVLLYKRGSVTLWGKTYPYVLYSRGSDGVDDNATAMVDPTISLSGISTEKGKDLILNGYHEKK